MKARWALIAAVLLATFALEPAPALGVEPLGQFPHMEGASFFTVVSDKGERLSRLSLTVSPGDYLVTEDNRGWKIYAVSGQTAKARFDKWIDLEAAEDHPPAGEAFAGWIANLVAQAGGGGGKKTIGIYQTHSGESYKPTSGTATKNTGDINKVGATLAAGLRDKGFKVIHSYNNHNPQDASSYVRSRRTAFEMLRKRPVALFDVHRDGIPDPDYYKRQVSGKQIAQIRLVVGKQNANRSVNFDFAKKIKADASRIRPGLVKEIFWAKGDYNQDLGPRTILFEFGTYTNSLSQAEEGASLLADVIPVTLTGRRKADGSTPQGRAMKSNPSSPRLVGSQGRTGGSTALWLILILVGGGLLFLAINAGGIGGIGKQLKKFTGQELSGFLGRYRKGREQTGGPEKDRAHDKKCADEKKCPDGEKGDGPGPIG